MSPSQFRGEVRAPDFPNGLDWINSDHPLHIKEFRDHFQNLSPFCLSSSGLSLISSTEACSAIIHKPPPILGSSLACFLEICYTLPEATQGIPLSEPVAQADASLPPSFLEEVHAYESYPGPHYRSGNN